jgi:carbonic anhydrase
MIEIVWRYDPAAHVIEERPADASAARARLDAGSAHFAALSLVNGRRVVPLPPDALGIDPEGDGLAQEPFAAILGCADARVPAELIFGQAANDLFVVRVAGNVPGAECLGSLDYAVEHLHSLRLIAVVGHTGCGAVGAAVRAYRDPEVYFAVAGNPDLRQIVDAMMVAVTTSAQALESVHGAGASGRAGYEHALTETAVVVNAALTASLLQVEAKDDYHRRPGVVFGVYHIAQRSVGIPTADGWRPGLVDPPHNAADLFALAQAVGASFDLS